MKLIGNILWLIFGGLMTAFGFLVAGVVLCITIIGIPFGKQMFKFAELSLAPFGKEIDSDFSKHPIINSLWIIFAGIWIAMVIFIGGLVYCITIIGIPMGLQLFKYAKLVLCPFGAEVK